jgi:murein DD-endopeptidase MepM/ murein hydrolase activator NlpD
MTPLMIKNNIRQKEITKRSYEIALGLLIIFHITSCGLKQKECHPDSVDQIETSHIHEYGICIDSLNVNRYKIKKGDYLASILTGLGFTGAISDKISKVVSFYYSPSKLQIGNTYAAITTQDSTSNIEYLVFEKSKTEYVVVDLSSDNIKAYEGEKPITLQRKYAEGTITSSLWNAIIDTEAQPQLALKLSDLYAWQIDFFDIKEGDSFCLMYDEAYIDDTTFVDIVSIEGAVFMHQGKTYCAIPFEQDSVIEYFDEEGNSLRKEFLKSPLDFFRITSRFTNSRYHPILKRYRAHHGVDYAAPVGTPVKTIGDGVVIEKGYQQNGGGNYLKVKHNSVYTTTYMHLSRFAKGIKKGSIVKQGDIIAYVGSTGLSTGPHLDFRVYKNNQPINPLTMESPPTLPVKPELRDSFLVVRDNVLRQLDSLQQSTRLYASRPDSLSQDL